MDLAIAAAITLMVMGGPEPGRNWAAKYVSLTRKVLAAILKATVSRALVGYRPFPMTLSPLILWCGHSRD
jgi:hypothetical protein